MTYRPSTFPRRTTSGLALLLIGLLALPVRAQIAEVWHDAQPSASSETRRTAMSDHSHEAAIEPRAYAASCTFGGPSHDLKNAVWHSYVAPEDGTLSVTVAGMNVDLILTIMDPSRSAELACADSERFDYTGGIGFEAISDFPVRAGQRYELRTTAHTVDCNQGYSEVAIDVHTDLSFRPSQRATSGFSLAPSFSYQTLDSATLAFTLSESGTVRFTLYSADGVEVRSLVHEASVPGRHEVVFETGDLTPGLYTVQAEHKGEIQARQVRLTR